MRRTTSMRAALGLLSAGAIIASVFGSVGCGGNEKENGGPAAAPTTGAQVRDETIVHEACSESGHRVEALDTNNDGKPDIKQVYDGNIEICRISDMNHDGKPDLFEYFDKTGQIRRREIDFDDNGIANVIEHYENGKMTSRELDTTNQGRIDTWDTFDPATGKLVKRDRDSSNDGRIDQWWTWDGDKVTIAMDRNGDGLPDPDATVTMGGEKEKEKDKDAGANAAANAADSGASSLASPTSSAAATASTPDSTLDAGAADAGTKPKRGKK